MLSLTPFALAGTYIPLDDGIYEQFRYLEAEGVINSGLLTTAPLSAEEAVRLLEEAERISQDQERSAFIRKVIVSLRDRLRDDVKGIRFVKPLSSAYSRYAHANSDMKSLYYNNDGDLYDKGSNLRTGFVSRAELGSFSFYLNPEFRYSGDDVELDLKRGYATLSFLGLDLTAGKDSQWWGPGHHGSILLSNNAEPFTMVRLTNPKPVLLPSVLEHLGPFRFAFFVTRLEEERTDFPEPYLWGLRLNFKPHPYVEVGLTRTAILGGRGRSESLGTWWYSFTGQDENTRKGSGDQKAGFDIKVSLPIRFQPVQLYYEAEGEDQAGFLPSRWADLKGVYLPRILGWERLGLRVEYANTHVSGVPNYWYNHHIYTQGYTYKHQIIGHHMGTDSEDLFVELSYLLPERNGRISLSYDSEEHNLSGPVSRPVYKRSGPGREKKDEITLDVELEVKKDLMANVLYRYGKFRDFQNIPGNDRNASFVAAGVEYRF